MKKATQHKTVRRTKVTEEVPNLDFKYLDIVQIRLISSNAMLNLQKGSLPSIASVQMESGLGVSPDESLVKANVICKLSIRYEPDENEPPVFVKCEFQAVYKYIGTKFPTEQDVESDGAQVVLMCATHLWPYIRHYMNWTISQMGLPSFTLPLMKTKLKNQQLIASVVEEE